MHCWKEKSRMIRAAAAFLCLIMACAFIRVPMFSGGADFGGEERVREILAGMSMDEKISQMIIPAIRTWDGENVTDLSDFPELEEALQRHQYGGVILYGSNIADTGQVAGLISDLQANNARNESLSFHIPYFLPVDEEGGNVTRITTGTRMIGNMAIGATGEHAISNARTSGEVIGEELAALGFNTDFAPVIDVNSNAANPVIGTRSFSDDPETVASLGVAFTQGLSESGIIGTYKHYPGHGDTATDSHINTPTSEKTLEELWQTELIPFAAAVENGADMIMTAHITYPLIDEEKTFGDGFTMGYYPATMSYRMITQILREEMGFDGVVITDALEMNAIQTAGLVPGEEGSTEYQINIAGECIRAGADILLLPLDLTGAEAAAFYDDYIEGLIQRVEEGSISRERIDESVARILKLKEKYGILETDVSGENREEISLNALDIVGSGEHHAKEMEMARQAVTLIKNEGNILPLSQDIQNIVLLGRFEEDIRIIRYAAELFREQGLIASDAEITVDYYYEPYTEDNNLHYTEDLSQAISLADAVICFSGTSGIFALGEYSPQYRGICSALEDTREAGGRFILLSTNLPYDAARYQDADAIVLAYMGSGLDTDPTSRMDNFSGYTAFNANVIAAMEAIFGGFSPEGILPVNLPVIVQEDDGSIAYGNELLYERGFGLTYQK